MSRVRFSCVILWSFILTVGDLYAGDAKGNGGDVIACRDASGNIKYELLDYFEGRELLGLEIDTGPQNLTWLQKIEFILNRRKDVAPFRAKYWLKKAKEFEAEARWLERIELTDIPDSEHIVLPVGCRIIQIAIQNSNPKPRQPRYVVHKEIWSQLDESNKAGLVLHEVIYSEALIYGHENSLSVRYLNALWSAKGDFEEFSSYDSVNKLFREAKFAAGETFGCSPILYETRFWTGRRPWVKWNEPLELKRFPNGQIEFIRKNFFHGQSIEFQTPFGKVAFVCRKVLTFNDPYFAIHFDETGAVRQAFYQGAILRGSNFEIEPDKDVFNFKDVGGYQYFGDGHYILSGKGFIQLQGQKLQFSGGIKLEDTYTFKRVAGVSSQFEVTATDGQKYINASEKRAIFHFEGGQLSKCVDCQVLAP